MKLKKMSLKILLKGLQSIAVSNVLWQIIPHLWRTVFKSFIPCMLLGESLEQPKETCHLLIANFLEEHTSGQGS